MEKKINKGPKEETPCCVKEEITSSEVCIVIFLLFKFKMIFCCLFIYVCTYRYICVGRDYYVQSQI